MLKSPKIPMSPEELPQQRVHLVVDLPEPPQGWAPVVGKPAAPDLPVKLPKTAKAVAQVEWAWSPMNMRIDAYYLSSDRILWARNYDDNWGRWAKPQVCAYWPRRGVIDRQAAIHLLAAEWLRRRDRSTATLIISIGSTAPTCSP